VEITERIVTFYRHGERLRAKKKSRQKTEKARIWENCGEKKTNNIVYVTVIGVEKGGIYMPCHQNGEKKGVSRG